MLISVTPVVSSNVNERRHYKHHTHVKLMKVRPCQKFHGCFQIFFLSRVCLGPNASGDPKVATKTRMESTLINEGTFPTGFWLLQSSKLGWHQNSKVTNAVEQMFADAKPKEELRTSTNIFLFITSSLWNISNELYETKFMIGNFGTKE